MNPSSQQVEQRVQQMLGAQPKALIASPDGALGLTDTKIAFAPYTQKAETPEIQVACDQIERFWFEQQAGGVGRLHVIDTNGKTWQIRLNQSDAPNAVQRLTDYTGVDPSTEDQSGRQQS